MYKTYGDKFKYIWTLNDRKMLPCEYKKIKTVKFLSFSYFYHVLTAKNVLHNNIVKWYLPFRKKQNVITVWHGGGVYKKIGLDASLYKKKYKQMEASRNKSAKMLKYIISSSKKFTEVRSKVWNVNTNTFLPFGMPRNDILFNTPYLFHDKVRNYFNIKDNKKIILYAPTYRGDFRNSDENPFSLDIPGLLNSLETKFNNEFVVLFRSHIYDKIITGNEFIIPASYYPDIQELLCTSDILITDYSSSIWDFSFTNKPCFLFTPDLKEYQEKQGFYIPIGEWPFPYAETNEKLIENILNFDEDKHKQRIRKHHNNVGSFENGTACIQFCDFLFK
jgi:CDP-glycerol glycerophosphotransferase